MGVIQKFVDLARFVGASSSAMRAANALQQERDQGQILALCDQVDQARAKANSNPTWGGFNEAGEAKNPAWGRLNLFTGMASESARAYAKQDYEAAFQVAHAKIESKEPAAAFMALNLAVDALGQVKTRLIKAGEEADYQSRFGLIEIELLAAANRAVAQSDPVGANGAKTTNIKITDPTHGLSMAAAYVNFIGGNLVEAGRWVDASVARSGAEPILKREIGEPQNQFWFYNQVDVAAMNQFRSFLARRLQPKPPAPGM